MAEVPILDQETGDRIGVLKEGGELHTEDDALAEIAREMSEEGGIQVMVPGGTDEAIGYEEWTITPDDEGFQRAFMEYLPSPYTTDTETYRDLPQYSPPDESYPDIEEDVESKAARSVAEAAVDVFPGDGTGNEETTEKASSVLSKEEFERCDDILREMHKNLVEWEGDDLSKAPPTWSSNEDIPEFVKRVIEKVIGTGDVVWDKFEGYSRQAAEAIQNSFEENLTQPQGWSLESLVEDLQEMYPGMDQEKATNIARTESSAILNSAREEAYKEQEGADDYVYYWQGPADHRRTDVCKEIVEEVESRGGSVPLSALQTILMNKARKYEGTREGGTPERVSDWTPHYQCRHTFIRDVKADL